jgi:thymidylate kinase
MTKIMGEDVFKLKDKMPIPSDSDRLNRFFVSRIGGGGSLPMTLPRIVTKGFSVKHTLFSPGTENLQNSRGGISAASMMVKNFVRRKLGGDLVRGKSVAISGPDGSGKTTIADMLGSALRDIGVPSDIYWSRYSVAGRMIKGSVEGFTGRTNEDTKRQRRRLPFESRIKLGAYAIQLSMKSAGAKFLRKNIIFDRHFLDSQVDYILDSGRSDDPISSIGFGLPPKPDLHIVLLSNPKILAERSREGLDLSIKKAAVYEEIIAKRPKARILRIDTAKGTGGIIDDLIPALVNNFSQRGRHE